jgi:hypothetical protein
LFDIRAEGVALKDILEMRNAVFDVPSIEHASQSGANFMLREAMYAASLWKG